MNEAPRRPPDPVSVYLIIVSLSGLIFVASTVFYIPITSFDPPYRKYLVGSAFGIICSLGMIVGVSRSSWSKLFHHGVTGMSYYGPDDLQGGEPMFLGHHPTCGKFSDHVIVLRGRPFCAGCSGLTTGAAISLLGSSLYFSDHLNINGIDLILFCLGCMLVVSGLIQYNVSMFKRKAAHLLVNIMFPMGASLVLIGADSLLGNLVLDSYLLSLIFFWIMTRIILSQKEHKQICETCDSKCKLPARLKKLQNRGMDEA